MEVELDKHRTESVQKFEDNRSIPLIANCTYNDFFEHFMECNKPCILTNVTYNWQANKYWVQDNLPNFDYLKRTYGACQVTIYDCEAKYYNSQKTTKSKFEEYVSYWIDHIKCSNKPLLYLKDWHLKNQLPEDNYYEVPEYFAADWLNEYLCENLKDDYRFVYMGPRGTWTPFHVDVFNSYSWSANVCGQKRWLLFPPGEENKLKDSLGNLPYDVTNTLKDCNYCEVIQNPGEALFVPSGWHHQVWNLKDTISVNHNWINGCNLKRMWLSLKDNLNAVKKEIEDCIDMENYYAHCQVMLQASWGMNLIQFFEFMKYIAVKRINLLDRNVPICLANDRVLGKFHAFYDLQCIEEVLELFILHEDCIKLEELNGRPTSLLDDIKKCILNNSLMNKDIQ